MKTTAAAFAAAVCLSAMALTASGVAAQPANNSGNSNAETRVPEMAQTAANEAAGQKKVCRSEKLTGSLTRVRRICQTQAEWDAMAQNTREGVDRYTRSATGQPSGGTPGF